MQLWKERKYIPTRAEMLQLYNCVFILEYIVSKSNVVVKCSLRNTYTPIYTHKPN